MNQHYVYGLVSTNDLYSIYEKADIEEVCGQFVTEDELYERRIDPGYMSIDMCGEHYGRGFAIVDKVKLIELAKTHLETNKVFQWSIQSSHRFMLLSNYNDFFAGHHIKYDKKKGGFIALPPPKDGPCPPAYITTVKRKIVSNGVNHLCRTIGFNADFKTGTHADLNGAAYVLKKLGLKLKDTTYFGDSWKRTADGEYFRHTYTFDEYLDTFELMPNQRKNLSVVIAKWWKEASKLPTNKPL